MKGYLDIPHVYLTIHKKRTILSILSVALAVALVTGVFSMLDVLLRFEKIQVIHDYGNYHLAIKDATEAEKNTISGRIDVKNTGTLVSFKQGGTISGAICDVLAVDENFAPNVGGIKVLEGHYPKAENELMLEKWAAEQLHVSPGDTIPFAIKSQAEKAFVVSGIFNDFGSTKASAEPGVVISMVAASRSSAEKTVLFLIEFKERADIKAAERQIREGLSIPDARIGRNEHLLAVIGQSDYKAAIGLYQTGAILFLIVLLAGVVMIYNTFNISVMERTRSFGLLRCVGASKIQIKKLVRKEGFLLLRWAIPGGVLLGFAATLFCSALLKFYNSYLFADIPLFTLSPIGIAAGMLVGILTVMIASALPAKKASRVSPMSAISEDHGIGTKKRQKEGALARLLPVDAAMGISSATAKKRTLALMSASIAISIAMFLGFNVFVDFMYTSLKTTKPYTADVSLTSKNGLRPELYAQVSELRGVKRAYIRMFSHVNASFDASRLTESYKKEIGNIGVSTDGLMVPPEKSWLISYDKNQLRWARSDLVRGELSEQELNEHNGIIAVLLNTRKNHSFVTASLAVGDKVFIDTPAGRKAYNVMAVLHSVPFADSDLNMTTFITTERLYTEITGDSTIKIIDIQLRKKDQEKTVARIRQLAGPGVTYLDSRQQNNELNQTFFTMAVFVYGFVAVIVLIGILNIVSTMHTSISSKKKYLGILRAVGMSGKQVEKMIVAEASTYCVLGTLSGCIFGIFLQIALITQLLTSIKIVWTFPTLQLIAVLLVVSLVTWLASIGPLRKIMRGSIADIIGSLQ